MRDLDQIKRVVTKTLRDEFRHVKIIEVRVHEDVDSDDDDVLRIDVIFEGTPNDLNASKLAGAGRSLQSRLNAIHESAMPLVSFISGADWGRRKRATA